MLFRSWLLRAQLGASDQKSHRSDPDQVRSLVDLLLEDNEVFNCGVIPHMIGKQYGINDKKAEGEKLWKAHIH